AKEDVDLAVGVIHVRHGWDQADGLIEPKSRAARRNPPIIPALRDELVEHWMRSDRNRGLFFGRSETNPFDPGSVNARAKAAWARTCRHCCRVVNEHDDTCDKFEAMVGIDLHSCRHTYASLLITAGANA